MHIAYVKVFKHIGLVRFITGCSYLSHIRTVSIQFSSYASRPHSTPVYVARITLLWLAVSIIFLLERTHTHTHTHKHTHTYTHTYIHTHRHRTTEIWRSCAVRMSVSFDREHTSAPWLRADRCSLTSQSDLKTGILRYSKTGELRVGGGAGG